MTTATRTDPAVVILGLLAVVPVGVAVGAWGGFVTYKFYGWFVVPLGAPVLAWWHIWGLIMLLGLATYRWRKTDSLDDDKPFSDALARAFGAAFSFTFLLIVGWLIQVVTR